MDIVIAGFAGLSGTKLLLENEKTKTELEKRFPKRYLLEAERQALVSDGWKIEAIARRALYGLHFKEVPCGLGEIKKGLWDLGVALDTGLSVDLEEVPIRQETIEIAEYFNLNPYRIQSNHMYIYATDQATTLVRELDRAGIPASIAGYTTLDNDRVIYFDHGREKRFLEPVKRDELDRILK